MEGVFLVGLSHQTAPLELRERLALSLPEQERLLRGLTRRGRFDEAVVLVTCNRVELYVATDATPTSVHLADLLSAGRDVDPQRVAAHAYVKRGLEAAAHAFHVAAGLSSMVIGETQVLGQLRGAYERAQQWGTTGPRLDPLMQRAIACGREVASRAAVAGPRRSVASVAVERADRELGGLRGRTVLCVGAGKIGGITLRRLHERGAARCVVANRDIARARSLAAEVGAEAIGLDRLESVLAFSDLVLCSSGAAGPLLTREAVAQALRDRDDGRPLVLIDLAVPRNIDPAVVELPGVRLLNLDDLQSVAREPSPDRQRSIARARAIVRRHVSGYAAWRRQQALGPVIDRLYQRSHALAEREVERALSDFPGISDAERAHWRELARRVVNQLLHLPVSKLGQSDCPRDSADAYLHALEHLFSLSGDDGDAATTGYPAPRDTGNAPRE